MLVLLFFLANIFSKVSKNDTMSPIMHCKRAVAEQQMKNTAVSHEKSKNRNLHENVRITFNNQNGNRATMCSISITKKSFA